MANVSTIGIDSSVSASFRLERGMAGTALRGSQVFLRGVLNPAEVDRSVSFFFGLGLALGPATAILSP